MFQEQDKSTTPEHSDRAKWVTNQVALWIANDSDYIGIARGRLTHGIEVMAEYLTLVIRTGKPYSAPWQVAQELAPSDYDRIRWDDVADEIREEE